LAALAALLVLGSACGGDDDGGDGNESGGGGGDEQDAAAGDDGEAGESGGGEAGDGEAGESGGGEAGDGEAGESGGEGGTGGDVVPLDAGASDAGDVTTCGSAVCVAPECCDDAFVSRCGLRVGEKACLPPQMSTTMSDERCPSVPISNGAFMIPSCCTEEGRCGIDANAAGMGCIALEEVIAFTSMDGGGGIGATIMWPEPKACD
jgi:hypothetical protein